MGKGFQGLALRVMGANDYRLTVVDTVRVGEYYHRVTFAAGGLLSAHPSHPTQWIRMWIPNGGKQQQRGYTVINPDLDADRFDVEFALHKGPASQWVTSASPGDTIDATVMGSTFALPSPAPSEYLIFGDTASLPAINTLLDAIGDVPARVWLEWQHEQDATLPVHATSATAVEWVQRVDKGRLLRASAEQVTTDAAAFAWIASDSATTRAIATTARSTLGLPRSAVKAQAYWR